MFFKRYVVLAKYERADPCKDKYDSDTNSLDFRAPGSNSVISIFTHKNLCLGVKYEEP